jgi:hypothetical protein
MPQVVIYLDQETAALLEDELRRTGLSRSAWVREAIEMRLRNRLPESFFELYGSWEDDREPEEILREIRAGYADRERPSLP